MATITIAHYFGGWWEGPGSKFVIHGRDWRPDYPERRPMVGWRDDQQEVMDNQILQAAVAGLDAFNILWYPQKHSKNPIDFDESPLLNAAFDRFMHSPVNNALQFILSYVNHPPFGITTPHKWEMACREWVRAFQHPRYLRVSERPLFIILGSDHFREQWGQEAPQAIGMLRKTAAHAGLKLWIGGGQATPSSNSILVKQEGYDFATAYALVEGERHVYHPLAYRDIMARHDEVWEGFAQTSLVPYLPVITTNWDPRPWYGQQCMYWDGKSPDNWTEFLRNAKERVESHAALRMPDGTAIYFFYAWNELGEGGFLVPTKGYGDEDLVKIRQVLKS